jgi:GxxExxY protein
MELMTTLIRGEETYKILGACFEVYRQKGSGFLEAVYQECLELEFTLQDIPWRSSVVLPVSCKGQILKKSYEADFVCFGQVIIEIKAVAQLADEHRAQILNYLHAPGFRVGLLVNFGHSPKVEHERYVL